MQSEFTIEFNTQVPSGIIGTTSRGQLKNLEVTVTKVEETGHEHGDYTMKLQNYYETEMYYKFTIYTFTDDGKVNVSPQQEMPSNSEITLRIYEKGKLIIHFKGKQGKLPGTSFVDPMVDE